MFLTDGNLEILEGRVRGYENLELGGGVSDLKSLHFNFFLKLLVLWHLPALWVWKKQKSFCLYIIYKKFSYLMYLKLPSQVLL